MNFQQLEYVVAVHQTKHFGHAAEACHVTQATLSAMIKKLEEELHLVFFDRSKKPVATTEAGLEFIARAQEILAKAEELRQIHQEEGPLQGKLRIGVIPTIANALLPKILPTLLDRNPNLRLEISEITTEEIKHQLSLDKIDMGILATPLADKDFQEHILYYEAMMVFGIEDDRKTFVSSADVRDQTIWLLEEGHCFRNQAKTICEIQEKQLEESRLNVKASSFETLLSLSSSFGGYTLVPELYVQNMAPSLKAKTRGFMKPIPVREISLVTYRPYVKTRAVQILADIIKKEINPLLSSQDYKNHELEIIGI